VNATLQAHLDGAAVPGLDGASLDFLQRQIVRLAPQRVAGLAFEKAQNLQW
jgi:hypothetical protein